MVDHALIGKQRAGHDLAGIVVAGWLLVALCGWLKLGPTWLAAMRPAPARVNDFYQDWASARNFHEGLPIYSPHSVSIPRYLGLKSDPNESIEYNAHPPVAVLLALPLGKLTYPDATLVWNFVSLAALALAFCVVAAELALPWRTLVLLLASVVYCHPIYGNIYLGQLNLILVLFVTAAWAQERNGRSCAAACLIGGAAAVKIFPAYLILYYAARWRFRPLFAVVGSFLALCALAALVLGTDAVGDYVGIVLPYQGKFRSCGYNISLAGFWHKLFDPAFESSRVQPLWRCPRLAAWGTIVSDLVVTSVIVSIVRRAQTPEERDRAFALVVTGMLLVSPVAWDVSLPLLIVPIAVIARGAGHSLVIISALLSIVLVIGVPQESLTALVGHPRGLASPAYMLAAPSVKFYALLGVLTLLLRRGGSRICYDSPTEPERHVYRSSRLETDHEEIGAHDRSRRECVVRRCDMGRRGG
ncbi:MAG: glycosyltransferase family 87 protein [Isosphaeraceae bacterium]